MESEPGESKRAARVAGNSFAELAGIDVAELIRKLGTAQRRKLNCEGERKWPRPQQQTRPPTR